MEKKGGHVSRRSESATSQVQRLFSWGRYLSPRGKHTHWYCCRSTAELWAVSSPSFRIFRNLGRSRLVSWPEKLPSALAQREARPETASPARPTYRHSCQAVLGAQHLLWHRVVRSGGHHYLQARMKSHFRRAGAVFIGIFDRKQCGYPISLKLPEMQPRRRVKLCYFYSFLYCVASLCTSLIATFLYRSMLSKVPNTAY